MILPISCKVLELISTVFIQQEVEQPWQCILLVVWLFTIIILRRWSSNEFLHYIRKQVEEEFSTGISNK
jgi:hypothetical protein